MACGVRRPASGVEKKSDARLGSCALTPHPAPRTPHSSGGFSLIEILVVLGLIAFLTAAIVVILPRVSNASKLAATRATIKKVDELLNDRINGFQRWIQTQNTLAGTNAPSYVVSAGYTTQYKQNPPLYQLLASKTAFRTTFPQNFGEMSSPPAYNAANHKQITESAACLYIILTQAAVFDTEPPAAAELKGVEVADTDGDGLLEVVDAWGQPLRYYRWPTRLFRPATSASTVETPQTNSTNVNYFTLAPAPSPASILISSAPRGPLFAWSSTGTYSVGQTIQQTTNVSNLMMFQCTTSTPPGTPGGTQPNFGSVTAQGQTVPDGSNLVWTSVLDPLTIDSDDPNGIDSTGMYINETTFHTWSTYHVPLIVSCGTDGTLGLYEPFDATNFGTLAQPQFDSTDSSGFARNALYDNITNHQQ